MATSKRGAPSGPLGQYAAGFRTWLLKRGYSPGHAEWHLRLMADASGWLEGGGLTVGGLTAGAAGRFLDARHAAGRREPKTLAGLRPMLDYLGGLGALPPEPPGSPPGAAARLIAEYEEYLRAERGLAPETVKAYSARAARFLARFAPGGDPGTIRPEDVTAAVLSDAGRVSAASAQLLVSVLRSFLRWCHVRGMAGADVASAAMTVTGRRVSMLPRGLEPGQVSALLASCDRSRPAGRRDYAVILLLARLGFRSGEIARIRLDDIGWRAGEIGIRGKGGGYDVLPLPADAGAALAAWLRDGRPAAGFREAFTTVTAPWRPLSPGGVGAIVRSAAVRGGMEEFGPHRLRHTAACAMIGAKVPLAGISRALRQRNTQVTAVYARAGLDRLRPLARPWPGTPPIPEGRAS